MRPATQDLLICLLLVGVGSLLWSAEPQELTATVAGIVDGDTITLADGDKVRLLGIDTPETVHPSKPVEAFGREASGFAKAKLTGEKGRLVLDPTNTAIEHRDKYGRLLAYVHRSRDGYDFNAAAIREGYAHAYVKFPFSRMDEFVRLERDARKNSRGLWAPKPEPKPLVAAKVVEPPHTPPSSNVDVEVYITKSGSKFHRLGCRHLAKSAIPISRDEAERRFSPCSACNP